MEEMRPSLTPRWSFIFVAHATNWIIFGCDKFRRWPEEFGIAVIANADESKQLWLQVQLWE